MALLTNRPDWTSLIKFTKNGIEIADYVQIRAAIVDRLKEIFGSDIDVATNTADGQIIEMDALIINNILQSVKSLYGNLDVDTAQGKFLDMLCKLSNVYRKPAQRSTASIDITFSNLNSSDITGGPNGTVASLKFLDINGVTWTWAPSVLTTLTRGTTQSVIVTCDEPGKIRANAGSITRLVETTYIATVSQTTNAEIGTDEETDAELRARRNGSLSVNATTVLQSLRAKLLDIAAVQDVLIYNNDGETSATADDGTSIPTHSVYAILRYSTNANVADSLIGTILYEYMTPGIKYAESAVTADAHSYTYESEPLPQIVHWKKATPVHPTITMTIRKLTHYTNSRVYSSVFDISTLNVIATAIRDYMNGLPLSEDGNVEFIKVQAQMADPMFKGQATYFVSGCIINGASTYANADTYYDYAGTVNIISDANNSVIFSIS